MDSSISTFQRILLQLHQYAGFALLLAVLSIFVLLAARKFLSAQDKITIDFIELVNKIILALSSTILLIYLIELFQAWFSGYLFEQFSFFDRALGIYWYSYCLMLFTIFLPQFFWKKKLRRNICFTLFVAFFLLINLFQERIAILFTDMLRSF